MVGIYKITSPSGRVYIGQSWDVKLRRYHYQSGHCKGQRLLYNSIRKYGWNNHIHELIHQLPVDIDQETLNTYEVLYWQLYKDCGIKMLNIREPGSKGRNSESTKAIWRITRRGRKSSELAKKKISRSLLGNKRTFGYHHTADAKAKMSASKIGNKNTLGFSPTKETREKMAFAQRGRRHSEETKKQMAESRKKHWEKYSYEDRRKKTTHMNTESANSKKGKYQSQGGTGNPVALIPGLN